MYTQLKRLDEATLDCDAFVRAMLMEMRQLPPERLAAMREKQREAVVQENAQREVARRSYLRKVQSQEHARRPARSLLPFRWRTVGRRPATGLLLAMLAALLSWCTADSAPAVLATLLEAAGGWLLPSLPLMV